ncbi:MAG: LamG-like jellyroll fold domain-containing protein [Sulfolobales archaeon]
MVSAKKLSMLLLVLLLSSVGMMMQPVRMVGIFEGQQVPECVPPPPGMVAWWPVDGPPGSSVAYDIAGTTLNNGTLSGTAVFVSSGKVGGALGVSGSGTVIVPDDPELDVGRGNFTIDLWINTSWNASLGFNTGIYSKVPSNSNDRGYSLALYFTGSKAVPMFQIVRNWGGFTYSWENHIAFNAPHISDNRWHHIAVVADATNKVVIIYVDGSPVYQGSSNELGNSLDNNASVQITNGNVIGNSKSFEGYVDEIELYKRALGESEIKMIYEAGSAGKCKPAATTPPPTTTTTQPPSVTIKTDKDAYYCENDKEIKVMITGSPNTTYILVVTMPNGTTLSYTVITDASGNAVVTIPLSPNDPSGVWVLTLYDRDRRVVAVWKFNVECKGTTATSPPPITNTTSRPPPTSSGGLCLRVVSDTTTFVDRGVTVVVNYTWPSPISSNNLGIPGAMPIWADINGDGIADLDTGNPFTFTKYFILPPNNKYNATLWINADDQWFDLTINDQFVASEPTSSWGNVHVIDVSKYLREGLNNLTVKAVDIGMAYVGLAFRLDVECTPAPGPTHWDKIIFTISVNATPTMPDNLTQKLRSLIGKTLDIKVRDDPSDVAVLEDKVKAFLAAKFNLTKQDLERIIVRIIDVEYAIEPSKSSVTVRIVNEVEIDPNTQSRNQNLADDNSIYYTLPLIMSLAGLGAFLIMRHMREQNS